MLYWLLKIPAKIAFLFYCRSARINNNKYLSLQGPLLLAANHPNSFLDAIIIATLFKKPVYSLTRGDVYKNKFYTWILTSLKMFPVYRLSEGADNLGENYNTFNKCIQIFKNNGIVLIFSEGRCENEWHLRPLKKGTARLAIASWKEGIPLTVLPVGINYQSFVSFGKNIEINFGDEIISIPVLKTNGYGKMLSDFNELLREKLQPLVVEIPITDHSVIKDRFFIRQGKIKRFLLSIPAVAGWLLHFPLYIPVKVFIKKKAGGTGHFDSIMLLLLFILYPFYLILITWLLSIFLPLKWVWPALIVIPFCAWSYIQLKRQFSFID